MSKLVIFLCLLNIFLNIDCQKVESPCPYTFGYKRIDGTWYGFIKLVANPADQTHRLEIKMSIATQITNGYVGKIERLHNANSRVNCALYFQVYFPSRYVLPKVELITHNNKIVCSGPPAKGEFVTTLALEHATTFQCSQDDFYDYPIRKTTTTPEPFVTKITRPIPSTQFRPTIPTQSTLNNLQISSTSTVDINSNPKIKKLKKDCGIQSTTQSLIVHGTPSYKGAYPWLAAIFFRSDFTCGGSLISSKHVITAAHCIILSSPEDIDDFIVFLGKHKLYDMREPGSYRCVTENIHVHPDYQKDNWNIGDADIAMITIREIAFTANIRPICIFFNSIDIDMFVGQLAVIAGWGRDELGRNATTEIRQTAVTIVDQQKCNSSHVEYANIRRSFCAGAVNRGPCHGDSGGGLFLRYDKKFHLRGIISTSLGDIFDKSGCDVTKYALYTDVCRFTEWITKFLSYL